MEKISALADTFAQKTLEKISRADGVVITTQSVLKELFAESLRYGYNAGVTRVLENQIDHTQAVLNAYREKVVDSI